MEATVGEKVVWTYEVTNPGTVPLDISELIDDNGTPGDGGDDFNPAPILDNSHNVGDTNPADGLLDPGEVWLYMAMDTVLVPGLYGNLAKVTGETLGSPTIVVMDTDPSHYIAEVPPAVCDTKVQKMLLSYTGVEILNATVLFEGSSKDPATALYENFDLTSGVVLQGQGDWTIDATASGKNDLGSKTKIFINGVDEVIHTSCSTPFLVGKPAPLDNPKGDPSPNWFVEAFEQKPPK